MQQLEDGSFFDPSIAPKKETGDMLEAGYQSHDFIVRTILDNYVSLRTFAQQKLWIAFYRYAGCPMCAAHFDEVMSYSKQLKEFDVAYLAVFDSAPDKIPARMKAFAGKDATIVGNDNLGLFETFGVEKSWRGLFSAGSLKSRIEAGKKGYSENNMDGAINRMPAHIFVYPGGEVAYAKYGRHAGDHVDWRQAWDFVKKPAKPKEDLGLSLVTE